MNIFGEPHTVRSSSIDDSLPSSKILDYVKEISLASFTQ